MPEPTGPCLEDDILVQPVVEKAVAGTDVMIGLELRTRTAEACTWQVSPDHLTLKVTSGSDDIWASRECPRAVPVTDVVVRQDFTTEGRRGLERPALRRGLHPQRRLGDARLLPRRGGAARR